MDQLSAFKADVTRTGNTPDVKGCLKALTRSRGLRALAGIRAAQAVAAAPGLGRVGMPIAKIVARGASHSAGVDIPWRTQLGAGVALTHAYGTVINGDAQIGNNVTIFHGVTLGQRDRIARDGSREPTGAPIIEDEVWIGPNAVIVGPVRVGRGSRIAAGAFVTEDVPPHSMVVGNPAQVVKTGIAPDVSGRAILD